MIASVMPEMGARSTSSPCTDTGHLLAAVMPAIRATSRALSCPVSVQQGRLVMPAIGATRSRCHARYRGITAAAVMPRFLCNIRAAVMPAIRATFMPVFRASKKTLQVNPLPPCTCVQGGTSSAGDFEWVVTKPKQSCTQPQTAPAGMEVDR
ncbi:Uncharacterised protein [Mycobacteroides abscessus subsp. abscessus]|nr:Uncharacterised protein [Mycobacteroides abscessus subsp. abscessus]